MLDFKELPTDGNRFEQLIRELLYKKGLEIYWSGKGADGGKDLLCIEKSKSDFKSHSKRWLIQCKHNAHSGRAVSTSDIDEIVDACAQHNASGYLLVCSTFPSSSVVNRLDGIEHNKLITTAFWDNGILERELMQPANWSILNEYFPESAKRLGWQINTLEDNFWWAQYKNNIFYISVRIGTKCNICFNNISNRLDEINLAKMPKGHIIRLRAVYYDNKNNNYHMYIDYLRPNHYEMTKGDDVIPDCLRDGAIDGVYYIFDVFYYDYFKSSDHFSIDHQDYYNNFIGDFRYGSARYKKENDKFKTRKNEVHKFSVPTVEDPYETFLDSFSKLHFIKIIRSSNAKIEFIDQFSEIFTWECNQELLKDRDRNFFDIEIRFSCSDITKLGSLLNMFFQNEGNSFSVVKSLDSKNIRDTTNENKNVYILKISVNGLFISSKIAYREKLNLYLKDLKQYVDLFLASQ